MEVKPGYKQTEMGIIPEDWEIKFLADVSLKITDGDHLTPKRESNGYFLLSARNILNGRIDVSDVDYVGVNEYRRMKQRCGPETGDILISCSGTIGRVSVVPSNFECVLVRSVALGKLDRTKAEGSFLQYWLQNSHAQGQITAGVNQGAQPNLFLNHIKKLVCFIPPLLEQRAIAAALSDVDALLDGLDRLIAKKRDLKQAAMQQLLTGQTRLPGFSGEWEVRRLGEIADVKTGPFGSSLHERDYVREGIPIITVEHLGEFGVEHINIPQVSETDWQRLRAYSLATGDIVFSRVGSIERNALIRSEEDGWLFSGRLLRIRLDTRHAYASFFSYQFHSEPFKTAVRSVAVGQTMASLNTQILNEMQVNLPSLPEQTAIATILSDMDAEIAALEARRDKTRALKQGMMQELLTGRIRLV